MGVSPVGEARERNGAAQRSAHCPCAPRFPPAHETTASDRAGVEAISRHRHFHQVRMVAFIHARGPLDLPTPHYAVPRFRSVDNVHGLFYMNAYDDSRL
jgi:hypothetical protein